MRRWAAGFGFAALLALAVTLGPGAGEPAGAYGLPEEALPPGYVALIEEPNEWPGIPAASTPTSAVTYGLPSGGTATVVIGPPDVVGGFVPDAPADEVGTSGGVAHLQRDADGRSVLFAPHGDEAPSVVVIGVDATDAELVSAFEASLDDAELEWEVLASDDDISVLVGGLPGQEMVYGDDGGDGQIHVLTVPAASLPTVLPYLTPQVETVVLDGTDAISFVLNGVEAVIWDAGEDLVLVAGPAGIGDGVMQQLAVRAEVVG